jgi:acyl-CoA synthetase (AMP-forming)/AMP-acid ligase II
MEECIMNIYKHIERQVNSNPDTISLIESCGDQDEKQMSYQTLDYKVRKLAYYLSQSGIQKGDRVVVMIPMKMELYVSLCAIIRLGAVAVFIDPHMTRKQLEHCSSIANAKAYISTPKGHLLRLFSKSLRRISCQISTEWLPGFIATNLSVISDFSLIQTTSPVPVSDNDAALISFTTGSSGNPKGSTRTHGFLNAQIAALFQPEEKRQSRIDLPGFPVLPLDNLVRGRTSILPPIVPGKVAEIDATVILNLISHHSPDMMSGSPAYLEAICDTAEKANTIIESVKILFTGGAPVSKQQLSRFQKVWNNARIIVVYGSTEAEPVARIDATEIIDDCDNKTQEGCGICIGYPIDQIDVLIIPLDDNSSTAIKLNGSALPPLKIGEIVVKGAHVNTHYWSGEEAEKKNKIKTPDGIWHRMGDAGYFDHHGRLWLVGRVHTAIKSPWQVRSETTEQFDYRHSEWILPYQVEAMVNNLPFVKRSAYVEVNNEHYLVVECHEFISHEIQKERMIRNHISGFPVTQIEFKTLPVDSRHNSKIDYLLVVAMLKEST